MTAKIEGIEEEFLRERYGERMEPVKDIAAHFNVSVRPIYRLLHEYNITIRPGGVIPGTKTIKGIGEQELRYMYYEKDMSMREIAEYYGINRATINNRFKEYGIKTKESRIKGIEKDDLDYMYNVAGMQHSQIAEYYNVKKSIIEHRMVEYGIKGRTRKYAINGDFFNAWTTQSAWVYGWLLGDGNYTETLRLRLELARNSESVIYKIKELLEAEHPVKRRKRWSEEYKKYHYLSYIQFYSKEMVTKLKSLSYSDIPEEYFCDFTRGFFEAEGYVGWGINKTIKRNGAIRVVFSQNDVAVLNFIHDNLSNMNIVNGGAKRKNGDNTLLIFSIKDSVALYHFMYDNCGDLFLPRKKERFEELIDRQLS